MAGSAVPQPSPAVSIRHLVKAYGEKVVLNRINLTLMKGEFVALLGKAAVEKPPCCGR